jgi:hypothetical protein
MKTIIASSDGMASVVPAHRTGVRDWQRWAPCGAVAWSLVYATVGFYWALGGRGFPLGAETASDGMGPLAGRFGPVVAWGIVLFAGIPAAIMGTAMLRGLRGRLLRPVFIAAGGLLAGVLLLLMTGLDLLVKFGYIPYTLFALLAGSDAGDRLLGMWTQWATIHQVLCLTGGFLWLAATVSYARRSGDACLYCGRREGPEGWTSPERAAHWGRIALVVAMAVPVLYALTRYAWALGIPLGISAEHLRRGQETGEWISGLFLATFGLMGAALMLGLGQRWGEVFPRWMIGLAGRRVPIALAVIPASLVSVLLIVGGLGVWFALPQMSANAAAAGAEGMELVEEVLTVVGPALLFPVWGVALAVATLGYYFRRRGRCGVCGRGTSATSTRQ